MRAINGALCFVAWLEITKILGHVRADASRRTITHLFATAGAVTVALNTCAGDQTVL